MRCIDNLEVKKLFDEVVKTFGQVNIAVNNVGKVLKKPITETTEEEYDEMYHLRIDVGIIGRFAINSKAAYFFIKEAALHIKPHTEGKIITIVTSLLAAFTGFYSTYAGAKAPVEHFCRAAAKELGEKGISVNNVGPGPMDTYIPVPGMC
jgi:NAD(P)-dependent dehydrogenase (short-subunit alcohol dehydrogenase family)